MSHHTTRRHTAPKAMGLGQYVEIVVGLAVLVLVFHDLFQAVVLPRPSVYRVRLASQLLIRELWLVWRWVGTRRRRQDRRENFLGVFGPAALLMLLAFWSLSLVFGYGLVFDGLRDQLRPPPSGFWTSLYFSGGTLLPLSYGDIVPDGGAARLAVLAESGSGVILVALVIALLFSLYQSFQAREELVVTLDALAGAPPSGLQILESAAADRMPQQLEETFNDWRRWSAAVLESHLAYPILFYFRSSHDNEAWLNSFGAVMDAATLVLTVVEHDSVGAARLMSKVGNHLVEDAVWLFRLQRTTDVGVERQEFDEARARLRDAGYRCRDAERAWAEFMELRRGYASPVNRMAHWLAIVPARWIGDRSYLPHDSSSRRRRAARLAR
jgi:Ion channel